MKIAQKDSDGGLAKGSLCVIDELARKTQSKSIQSQKIEYIHIRIQSCIYNACIFVHHLIRYRE